MKEERPEAPKGVKATRDKEGNVVVMWKGRGLFVGERGPEIVSFKNGDKYTVEVFEGYKRKR